MNAEEIYQKNVNAKIKRYIDKYDRIKVWEEERKKGAQPGDISFDNDASALQWIGMIMLYLKRYTDYTVCANLSADYGYLQIKTYGNCMTPNCVRAKNSSMRVMLSSALLSQNKNKIQKYAEFLKNETYTQLMDSVEEYHEIIGLMIRDLILNDLESAKRILLRFPIVEKRRKPSLIPVFTAIMKRNKPDVIEAIKEIIQYTIRTYHREDEVPISLEGIYYTLLAMHCGIAIKIKQDFEEKYQKFLPDVCFNEQGD